MAKNKGRGIVPEIWDDIQTVLTNMQGDFATVLQGAIDPERFSRVVLNSFHGRAGAKLMQAWQENKTSVIRCLMNCAEMRLEPDSAMQHCHLVPFNTKLASGKKAMTCTLIMGYRGFLELVYRAETVVNIWAEVVYGDDEFSYQKGTDPRIIHKPKIDNPHEDKDIIGVYSVAENKHSRKTFEVMGRGEVDKVRASSKASDDGPWVAWWGQMARKTVLRRLCKVLPMSSEFRKAESLDNEQYEAKRIGEAAEYREIPLDVGGAGAPNFFEEAAKNAVPDDFPGQEELPADMDAFMDLKAQAHDAQDTGDLNTVVENAVAAKNAGKITEPQSVKLVEIIGKIRDKFTDSV